MDRRTFLKGTGALGITAVVQEFPALVRGAGQEIKIGATHPLTGPMADIGQSCRRGMLLAVEKINAEGGIKSLGGAPLKLLEGDDQAKPEVGIAETERLIREGAVILTGPFTSQVAMAATQVAEQHRIPYVVSIGAADQITERGFKYTFRIFVTTDTIGQDVIKYIVKLSEVTNVPIKTAVLIHTNDLFGKVQSDKVVEHLKKAGSPFEIVERISYDYTSKDLSVEVARAKAAKPDVLLPISRLQDAILITREMFKQRFEVKGIIGAPSPGHYETEYIKSLGKLAEYTLDAAPWYNVKDPKVQAISTEFEKKFNKFFDLNAAYSYDAILVIADALERAASTEPDKLVEALRATRLNNHLMISKGPIQFDEKGNNINAGLSFFQIQEGRVKVIFPEEYAEAKVVFPVPLWSERK